MRITFQSKPEDKAHFFIRISEFSFEAYPVQVGKIFRAIPAAPISEMSSHHSRQPEIGTRLLRRVLGFLSTSGISLAAAKASGRNCFDGFLRWLNSVDAVHTAIPRGANPNVDEITEDHTA
jgi:hypothetical protein